MYLNNRWLSRFQYLRTVSLLNPSISGKFLILLSILFLKTSRKSAAVAPPDSTIRPMRGERINTEYCRNSIVFINLGALVILMLILTLNNYSVTIINITINYKYISLVSNNCSIGFK